MPPSDLDRLPDLTFRVLKNRKPVDAPGGRCIEWPVSYTILLEKPKPPRTCWERILEAD